MCVCVCVCVYTNLSREKVSLQWSCGDICRLSSRKLAVRYQHIGGESLIITSSLCPLETGTALVLVSKEPY